MKWSSQLPRPSDCHLAKTVGHGRLWLHKRVQCRASTGKPSSNIPQVAAKQSTMTIHIDQTSLTFPFKLENGRDLDGALQLLLQTFAAKQKAERPQRWKSMEYRLKDESSELELVGFFCNPNAAATAFDAKILITVKSKGGIQLTTEGRLSALKADLDNFMADCK